MKTAVVIPAWKGLDQLKKNLPAVLKMGADEIIVVDDASSENDGEYVKQNFPQIKVITNQQNLGFGQTVNKGVSATGADVVILLNQDVHPQPNIVKYVTKHFEKKDVFAVSLAETGYGPSIGIFKNGYISHQPILPRPKETSTSFWASGGSGAFRKSMWDKLGGFDLIYDPGYWEDVDICFRAQKQGWMVLWEPNALVNHEHETSFGSSKFGVIRKQRLQERNHLLFNWKNLRDQELIRYHLKSVCLRLIRHPGYFRIILLAVIKLIKQKNKFQVQKSESKTEREILKYINLAE